MFLSQYNNETNWQTVKKTRENVTWKQCRGKNQENSEHLCAKKIKHFSLHSVVYCSASNVLPLYLNQIFPPIIWIFTEHEGDGIKSRLPFKTFSTLKRGSTAPNSIQTWPSVWCTWSMGFKRPVSCFVCMANNSKVSWDSNNLD